MTSWLQGPPGPLLESYSNWAPDGLIDLHSPSLPSLSLSCSAHLHHLIQLKFQKNRGFSTSRKTRAELQTGEEHSRAQTADWLRHKSSEFNFGDDDLQRPRNPLQLRRRAGLPVFRQARDCPRLFKVNECDYYTWGKLLFDNLIHTTDIFSCLDQLKTKAPSSRKARASGVWDFRWENPKNWKLSRSDVRKSPVCRSAPSKSFSATAGKSSTKINAFHRPELYKYGISPTFPHIPTELNSIR